ncbi:lipoprotein [Spiroplasma citri]|uniref:lipoprotein n=1 Tax=Spiroplasma citri TaxID=2133 RepID=UPI001EF7BC9C|nr:lipoprotein [Spiroplasma citri]
MKKILSILGAVSLTVTGASSVIACGCNKSQQNIKILNKIIKCINLGAIFMKGEIPTVTELLVYIKAKNSSAIYLTENDFAVKGTISKTTATIIGKGNFTGEVTLNYTKKEKVDISLLKTIEAPAKIIAENIKYVSKDEWWNPTRIKVFEAIQNIDKLLTKNDYEITCTCLDFFDNGHLDLSTPKILSLLIKGKNNAYGSTSEIDITLPIATTN